MKALAITATLLGLFAAPALMGCEHEIAHDQTVTRHADGTVSRQDTTVTERPDGSVVTETNKTNR